MSELRIPGATPVAGPTAMQVARDREDVVIGDELVRHKLSSRVIHWTVAVFFFVALLSGMPIWSPVFGWMAFLFGGLSVCRWLHPWSGVAFAVASLVMFVLWVGQMRFDATDRKFNVMEYLRFSGKEDPEVGKYNAGQKFFFWMALFTMLALLLTGIVLWWPSYFSQTLRSISILLHDLCYIGFFAAIVGHIYLGTAAEPGTFRSMTRGTVTRPWARLHHPRWYRDVTGDRR
ncbi:MAG TPA: formate dehydrogenase subunit gamma [Myxococcales bacterium]|jgi:formate dehydrogenase subunit gamma|nr:formate dehydrogenase subunit gamma [Myxococcales bacterium]